jgi:ParB/RepB/Spo0J family partition protein
MMEEKVREIDIDDVIIASDYRQEVTNVGELALSIKSVGLIHPIRVVRKNNEYHVDTGRRRLRALKMLNVKKLVHGQHFLFTDEGVDSLVMQLAENFSRETFHPLEAAHLLNDIHQAGVKKEGKAVRGSTDGWSLKDTARITGLAPSTVSQYVRLWTNRDAFSEKEKEEMSSISDTILELRRRRTGSMLKRVRKQISKKVQDSIPQEKNAILNVNLSNFKCMDARDYIKTIPKPTHIITDPPFAVNLDLYAGSHEYECYEDDEKKYIELMTQLVPEFAKLIDNGYIVLWCSFMKFNWLLNLCEVNGITCSHTPFFWRKTNTGGSTANATMLLPNVMECGLYGWRGSVELSEKGRANCLNFPTPKVDRIHVAQKDLSLQKAILKIFTNEGDTILDCFAGSASMLRACVEMERVCYSCELNEDLYNSAMSECSNMLHIEEEESDENS